MLSPPILITIITVGGFVILAICAFGCFNMFKTNRRRLVKVLEGLKYIPEVIEIKEEYIEVKKKLTKRQQRRKKMRELERELKLSELNQENEENVEETEDHEDEMEDTFLSSPSSKLISWVINTFSTKSNKIIPNYSTETDIEIGEPMGFSTKSNYHSNNEVEQQGIGSTKSKRFISQDRIQRKEARILLIQPKNNHDNNIQLQQEEEQKYDTTISLLSLKTAKQEYIKELIEKRKFRKQLCQDTDIIHTDMNEIKVNAGPPTELIPEGYELVSQDLGEELLNPDILIYKRILYLWETCSTGNGGNSNNATANNITSSSSEANNTTAPTTPITTATGGNNTNGIIGWYIGTIVGISEQAEYNYRIKYDRKETKSIFVDGIQPVYLSLSGVNAYGRRWVLLQKTTGGS